jgi:integrase
MESALKLESNIIMFPEPQYEHLKLKVKKKDSCPYSEYKSDGKLKAHAVESIKSYDEFKAIQNYFLERNRIRDYALWTIGVSLGIRISDLTSLKIKHLLDEKMQFRKKILIREQKTHKAANLLITESVIDAATKYFDSIKFRFDAEDYLFKSQKQCKLTEQSGWRIISTACKKIGLNIIAGSHTMRKSFVNIALCVSKTSIDMNLITKAQALLQHDSQLTTMRYLGVLKEVCDADRVAVSDFILGKSTINKLTLGLTSI